MVSPQTRSREVWPLLQRVQQLILHKRDQATRHAVTIKGYDKARILRLSPAKLPPRR